jgi:hypothetical protein
MTPGSEQPRLGSDANLAQEVAQQRLHQALEVAAQVAFVKSKGSKPGFHSTGSRLETMRLSSYAGTLFPCYIWWQKTFVVPQRTLVQPYLESLVDAGELKLVLVLAVEDDAVLVDEPHQRRGVHRTLRGHGADGGGRGKKTRERVRWVK